MSTHPTNPACSTHPAVSFHPLVQAYLADLDRALSGVDPRERADVLDGVREHLRDALGRGQGEDEARQDHSPDRGLDGDVDLIRVREVLADLGPVEAIAAQASTTPPEPTHQTTNRPAHRDTTSLVALFAAIGAAVLVFVPFVSIPLAIAALVTSAVHLRSPGASRGRCWAGIAVSTATLVVLVVAGASLLAATTSWDSGPTSVTSVPAE